MPAVCLLTEIPDAAWESLLPHLVHNKSAGAVALCCSRLRQHVQQGTQRLSLQFEGDPAVAFEIEAVDALPDHFPGCKEIDISLNDEHQIEVLSALPVLSRFSQLSELSLRLPGVNGGEEGYVEDDFDTTQQNNNLLLVGLARLQLTALRSLHITTLNSWLDNSSAWLALGRMKQLTELEVHLQQHMFDAVTLQHLSALRLLGSGLQSLAVTTACMPETDEDQEQQQQQQYEFLQHLTNLTSLQIPVASKEALEDSISSSITCLTKLEGLTLDAWSVLGDVEVGAAGSIPLGSNISSALARLTNLESLQLPGCRMSTSFPTLLTKLNKLQSVDLDGWSTAMLPALAQCTQLTALHGSWVEASAAARRRTTGSAAVTECPSMRTIAGMGCVPVAAFKQLEHISQWEAWPPDVYSSIARHCQQLQGLHFTPLGGVPSTASMPAAAPAAQRAKAVRGLSRLQHLQELMFVVNDSAEAAALAALTQLQRLWLRVPAGSSCSITGLMHLVALRRLQQLTLVLDPEGLAVTAEEAESLLVALQFIPSVEVQCRKGRSLWGAFDAAQAALRDNGMLISEQLGLNELE